MASEIGPESVRELLECAPAGFAITHGPDHVVWYANSAFCALAGASRQSCAGHTIAEAFAGRATAGLGAVLDRVYRTGVVERDCRFSAVEGDLAGNDDAPALRCTVWPNAAAGRKIGNLLIELRIATPPELELGLQREVAERMLLSALRERATADVAENRLANASFLAAEGRRLAAPLDQSATLAAVAKMMLPRVGGWSIVDTIADDGAMRRIGIIHPDPQLQTHVDELKRRWAPQIDDPFGVPAMTRSRSPLVIEREIDQVITAAAHDADTVDLLRALGAGPLLTVPLVGAERLLGALTFVAGRDERFTSEDVELALDLADRGATALDRARLFDEAVELRRQAESANQAKSKFLASLSHELRTPLNAIAGYVDLMELGVHDVPTEEQRLYLGRIRASEHLLAALVEDLLNFARLERGDLTLDVGDVIVRDALVATIAIVEPIARRKGLACDVIECDPGITARADGDKLSQILLNLVSNAIKFTGSGGRVTIGCRASDGAVHIEVADTGIGIPPEKLDAIFDPFVQVTPGLATSNRGVGLGLAIGKHLAQAMRGDLSVESVLGAGTRFVLSLPRAR